MKKSSWMVHKFGGTSVASSERYRAVAEILKNEPSSKDKNLSIVVSAMSKVTDALLELVELAKNRNESYLSKLESLKAKHLTALEELEISAHLKPIIESDFAEMTEVLRGVWLVRSVSDRTAELVSGYGEIWSAQILNAHLQKTGVKSTWLDARKVLVVQSTATGVVVDWEISQKKINSWLESNPSDWLVITGFIASTTDDIPTTLKRNGSDFSASIFGKLLDSSSITIWTDVDGVLSADPRLVPEAVVLKDLSYQEATELAYFGAKVVHPSTMFPAIEKKIPIWIRNTFNPNAPGTKIHTSSSSQGAVKGFATVNKTALINVEGTGMIGVPGVAQRLFGALRDVGVSVIMISQASSEHSICFAVPQAQSQLAKSTVEEAFFAEIHHGQIQKIEMSSECCILAAVGDSMAMQPGVAGKFTTALGSAGVNIRALAQGSSERNISVVVDEAHSVRALRAVHSAFYLSNLTLSIGIIGPGLIGSTLLSQLQEASARLKAESKIDLRVRGLMNSKKMLLEESQIPLSEWKHHFENTETAADLSRFAQHIRAEHLPHAVIIDCTSTEDVPQHYSEWLKKGLHLITPNKKGNTGSMDFYRELKSVARAAGRHYLYETTVGAALPIINTLRDLVQTGDHVNLIEGVFSGTLSFLFNSFTGQKTFSEIVLEAKAKGFTEPDPRDDLSGMDVARKLVILARETGLSIELEDIKVESLVPEKIQKGSLENFMKLLPGFDHEMKKRLDEALKSDEVLRFVGVLKMTGSKAEASVALKTYPKNHSFAQVKGSDNIVAFHTSRYCTQPLIVQGPGAGPEVTAGGVFADLLRLSSYLGATT